MSRPIFLYKKQQFTFLTAHGDFTAGNKAICQNIIGPMFFPEDTFDFKAYWANELNIVALRS